jgi:hypothetical protein
MLGSKTLELLVLLTFVIMMTTHIDEVMGKEEIQQNTNSAITTTEVQGAGRYIYLIFRR